MKTKGVKFTFIALLAISTIVLLVLSIKTKTLINNAASADAIATSFSSLQKSIGLINITAFIVLLLIALLNFFWNNAKNYILLANLLFMGFTLNNYISMSKAYFNLVGNSTEQSGGYWLMVLIAVFYILGGILISAIGYITVRNYTNRNNDNSENKMNKRFR